MVDEINANLDEIEINLMDIEIDDEEQDLPIFSGRTITIGVHGVLSLVRASLPAYGDGYFRVRARVSQKDGSFKKSLLVSGPDITPAGSGRKSADKVESESIMPGIYSVRLETMSYWKQGGRLQYSTEATIQIDGVLVTSLRTDATQGQENPRDEALTFRFKVV
ncbi:hypothetical protein ACTM2X_002923 [Vibrio parahaemolyticus]